MDQRDELEKRLRLLKKEKALWAAVIVGQCLIIALGCYMVSQGI